jgi:hypothetical protein
MTAPKKSLNETRQGVLDALGTEPHPPYGDLVRARFLARDGDEQLYAAAKPVADQLAQRFEHCTGRIVNEYQCTHARSACALVKRKATGRLALYTIVAPDDDRLIRLESRGNRLAGQLEEVSAATKDGRLAVSVDGVMNELFSAMTHVLSAADELARSKQRAQARRNVGQAGSPRGAAPQPAAPAAQPTAPAAQPTAPAPASVATAAALTELPTDQDKIAAGIATAATDLDAAQRRIETILQRRARTIYFAGVVVGAVITIALCAGVGAVNAHLWWKQIATTPLVLATVIGALAAIASVFQRMQAGQLRLDINAGRGETFFMGMFRPFIGSIFAAIAQFAVTAGLLGGAANSNPTPIGLIVLVGAAAGFSERFATDMLERAGRVMFGPPDRDPQTPAGALAAPASPPPAVKSPTITR